MKWFKKILFPIFSVFLLFRAIELTRQVVHAGAGVYNISEMVLIALLLLIFITGIFALPGFAYPTSKILPWGYYRIRNAEKLKWIFRKLGVKYFKFFLMLFFWGRAKNRVKYFDGKRSGIQNLIYQSNQSEFGHLCAFFAIFLVNIVIFVNSQFEIFLMLTFLNILANLYPILLQRHHRMRIQRLFPN